MFGCCHLNKCWRQQWKRWQLNRWVVEQLIHFDQLTLFFIVQKVTMSLVSFGDCLFFINFVFAFVDGPMNWDMSHISAAIPSGVGFLGAGLIFKEAEKDKESWEMLHVLPGKKAAVESWDVNLWNKSIFQFDEGMMVKKICLFGNSTWKIHFSTNFSSFPIILVNCCQGNNNNQSIKAAVEWEDVNHWN